MPSQHDHCGLSRTLLLELEKVQHCATLFVNNNYCMDYSKCNRNDLRLGDTKKCCQKAHLCMMYKAINSLVEISMDHYQPSATAVPATS